MNLSSVIDRGALYFGNKSAVVHGDRNYTYTQLKACIDSVAAHLKQLGIEPGDRVGLFMPNRPEWIFAYFGIVRLGAVAVCLGAAYLQGEIRRLLNEVPLRLLITCEQLTPRLSQEATTAIDLGALVWETDPALSAVGGLRSKTSEAVSPHAASPDDACVVLFTGGTTGTPKGAVLTHANILYTCQNVCYHEQTGPRDVALCFMPLNHVFGANHIMNATFYGGGTLVLHDGFDLDRVLASIEAQRVTRFYAVPTVYIRLLNTPGVRQRLASVEYCFSAATSMASEVVRQWRKTFRLTIHEAYGMTETSSLVTFNHRFRHKIGSVGTPAGIVEVGIVDLDGRPVPAGGTGEIRVRGPNVMKGYYNNRTETDRVFKNGWLHTGDIGRLDGDGYLFIVDRLKDMIISGGLNVYPNEVEEILYTHPAVEECAVVGRPHPEYGEAVTAYVKAKDGAACGASELIGWCKSRLASYKAPKTVVLTDALPKSATGKILRKVLRETVDR